MFSDKPTPATTKAGDILGKVGRRFTQEILVDRSKIITPLYDKINNK